MGIFFIIPECVYSPMSVNSICISVNGRNFHQEISAGTRENLSNLLRLNGGVPSPASVFSNSSQIKKKKVLFYFPEISPSPTPACPAGRTGMVCSTSCQVQAIFRSLRQASSPLQFLTLQHKQMK